MSNEEEVSIGALAAAEVDEEAEEDAVEYGSDGGSGSDAQWRSEEEDGSEYEDSEEESINESRRVHELVDYALGYGPGNVTLEGLQERTRSIPADILEEKATRFHFLHHYLASSDGPLSLDVFEYLLSLAPEAVKKVDEGRDSYGSAHPYGKGSLPLHLALFNAHCPTSVIKLLLELNPSAIYHSWEKGYGLPLHCYIAGALKHYPRGEWCHEEGYFDEWAPAYPTRELDYDIVKILVEANPDALTYTSGNRGTRTPLRLLCEGRGVTLPLAKLLTDREQKCMAMGRETCYAGDEVDKVYALCRFPVVQCLLENSGVDPFPTDVFRYLLEGALSSLRKWECESGERKRRHSLDGSVRLRVRDSALNLACANPHMSSEVVQSILESFPEMISMANKTDGCLPLHTLCKNEGLSEQTSMDILALLLREYPESAKERTGKDGIPLRPEERKLPIHIACTHKTVKFCKLLLEKHPEGLSEEALHYPDKWIPRGTKVLPFHLACSYGTLELVQCLIEMRPRAINERTYDSSYKYDEEMGSQIEADDVLLQTGDLPLHLAVSRKNCPEKIKVVKYLLQKDRDAASKAGTWDYLPLHQACEHPDLAVLRKLLCSYPAAINAKNIFGQLPLHLLMRFSDEDSFGCLQFLAEQQPDALGILDSRGMSCAHYACTSDGALKKLQLIADIFPEVLRRRSKEHGLPIHYACTKKCKVDVVQFLADQFPESLDVHIEPFGMPLHCAASKPEDLEHDNRGDETGWKSIAASRKLMEFILAKRYGSPIEEGKPTLPIYHLFLCDERIKNKDPVIEHFRYKVLSPTDGEGRTLLHLVFGATQNSELLKARVHSCGFSGTLGIRDKSGWLPLHYALRHNALPALIRYMMEKHTVESGLVDVRGMTLLHVACQYGCSLETVEMIVEHDPTLTTLPDEHGDLPLHKACRAGNADVVNLLLNQSGDHFSVRNSRNELPLHLLCSKDGKDEATLESTEYIETIINLLLAYPETVLVEPCPYESVISDAVERVQEFYADHPEIKASHGWEEHVSVVFDHTEKALISLEGSLPSKDEMEIKLAALLHDVDDRKYFPDTSHGTYPNARAILEAVGISERDEDGNSNNATHERIIKMISWVGCSENGNSVPDEVRESEAYHMLIPRWADRLEAVGAKGVVRCYQYNQEKGRPLWSEHSPRPTTEEELWSYALPERLQEYMDRGTSTDMISHYYDKLLHIARPPKDIVCNPYLERMSESSSNDLVDVCLRFGRSGEVDEAHILALVNELREQR